MARIRNAAAPSREMSHAWKANITLVSGGGIYNNGGILEIATAIIEAGNDADRGGTGATQRYRSETGHHLPETERATGRHGIGSRNRN